MAFPAAAYRDHYRYVLQKHHFQRILRKKGHVSRTEKDLPTVFQIPEPFNRKIEHLYVLIIPAP